MAVIGPVKIRADKQYAIWTDNDTEVLRPDLPRPVSHAILHHGADIMIDDIGQKPEVRDGEALDSIFQSDFRRETAHRMGL